MNIGIITQTNEKGQIVIPKAIRDSLGINKNIPLKIVQRGGGIYLYPIRELIEDIDGNTSYLKILEKTQGAWAGDDWPETEKRRHKIEIKAAKRRRNVQW